MRMTLFRSSARSSRCTATSEKTLQCLSLIMSFTYNASKIGLIVYRSKETSCHNCRMNINTDDLYDSFTLDHSTPNNRIIEGSQVHPASTSMRLTNYTYSNKGKTRKNDFVDLLLSEGRFYLPAKRNLSAKFIGQFLVGQKRLFKIADVNFVGRIWRFKSYTTQRVWSSFPQKVTALYYLPNDVVIQKLDKVYLFSVGLLDSQYYSSGIHRQHLQGGVGKKEVR